MQDQSEVISGDFGGGIRFQNGFDLSLIERIEAHEGQVFDLDLSPGGTLIVSAGDDGVRVWNVADRSLHADLGFDGASIRFVRFLDEDRVLLVASVTSTAIVVTLDPDDLAAAGNAKVTRAFTATECTTYRIDPCPTLKAIQTH